MRVALVAAVARGDVIGRDGGIPWQLAEDLARFKELTLGHPVVMGRRTWDSLPDRFRPLPGRRNIVVTRNPTWMDDGAESVASVEEALALVKGVPQVFVIGGAQVYETALPYADQLLLTELELDVEGDTLFPPCARKGFDETSREPHVAADGTAFAFATYTVRT